MKKRLLTSKEFLFGVFFALFLFFVYSNVGVFVKNVSALFDNGEVWECVEWVTPCGKVSSSVLVFNNSVYNWSDVGCPIVECGKQVLTRTLVEDVNITLQPNLGLIS